MKFRGCRQRARKIQATRFPIATYPNSSEALVTSLTRVSLPLDRDNEFPPSPQGRIEGISTERPFARSACLHHRFFNGRGGFGRLMAFGANWFSGHEPEGSNAAVWAF